MFAFPHGMRLTLADAGQFPLPLFFTFVFTDSDGKHFYVACLQFYEQVHEADLQEVFCSVHGADKVRFLHFEVAPSYLAMSKPEPARKSGLVTK
jgi:hypothetical protein